MLINNQQYINCLTNTRSTPTLISFVWELSKPTEAVFSTSVNPKAFWNWKGSSGGLALPYMLSETIWNKSHMESDPSVSDFWVAYELALCTSRNLQAPLPVQQQSHFYCLASAFIWHISGCQYCTWRRTDLLWILRLQIIILWPIIQ